jgi:hypothetical protein
VCAWVFWYLSSGVSIPQLRRQLCAGLISLLSLPLLPSEGRRLCLVRPSQDRVVPDSAGDHAVLLSDLEGSKDGVHAYMGTWDMSIPSKGAFDPRSLLPRQLPRMLHHTCHAVQSNGYNSRQRMQPACVSVKVHSAISRCRVLRSQVTTLHCFLPVSTWIRRT